MCAPIINRRAVDVARVTGDPCGHLRLPKMGVDATSAGSAASAAFRDWKCSAGARIARAKSARTG
jgi:hypothetical protein